MSWGIFSFKYMCLAAFLSTYIFHFSLYFSLLSLLRLCQVESIKTEHRSETCFYCALCASLCEPVNMWYFQMHTCECAYVCVCANVWVNTEGGGSPGGRQYDAVVQHTLHEKTPPMGPGQLWPTYTASWALTSHMTSADKHILTYYGNPCCILLFVCYRSVSPSHNAEICTLIPFCFLAYVQTHCLPFFIHTCHYFCLPHRNSFRSKTSSKHVPACTNGRTF